MKNQILDEYSQDMSAAVIPFSAIRGSHLWGNAYIEVWTPKKPRTRDHLLITTKVHYKHFSELPQKTYLELHRVIQKIGRVLAPRNYITAWQEDFDRLIVQVCPERRFAILQVIGPDDQEYTIHCQDQLELTLISWHLLFPKSRFKDAPCDGKSAEIQSNYNMWASLLKGPLVEKKESTPLPILKSNTKCALSLLAHWEATIEDKVPPKSGLEQLLEKVNGTPDIGSNIKCTACHFCNHYCDNLLSFQHASIAWNPSPYLSFLIYPHRHITALAEASDEELTEIYFLQNRLYLTLKGSKIPWKIHTIERSGMTTGRPCGHVAFLIMGYIVDGFEKEFIKIRRNHLRQIDIPVNEDWNRENIQLYTKLLAKNKSESMSVEFKMSPSDEVCQVIRECGIEVRINQRIGDLFEQKFFENDHISLFSPEKPRTPGHLVGRFKMVDESSPTVLFAHYRAMLLLDRKIYELAPERGFVTLLRNNSLVEILPERPSAKGVRNLADLYDINLYLYAPFSALSTLNYKWKKDELIQDRQLWASKFLIEESQIPKQESKESWVFTQSHFAAAKPLVEANLKRSIELMGGQVIGLDAVPYLEAVDLKDHKIQVEVESCQFCNPERTQKQTILSYEGISLLYDWQKQNSFLLIPQEHLSNSDSLSEEQIAAMFKIESQLRLCLSKQYPNWEIISYHQVGASLGENVRHKHWRIEAFDPTTIEFMLTARTFMELEERTPKICDEEMQELVEQYRAKLLPVLN